MQSKALCRRKTVIVSLFTASESTIKQIWIERKKPAWSSHAEKVLKYIADHKITPFNHCTVFAHLLTKKRQRRGVGASLRQRQAAAGFVPCAGQTSLVVPRLQWLLVQAPAGSQITELTLSSSGMHPLPYMPGRRVAKTTKKNDIYIFFLKRGTSARMHICLCAHLHHRVGARSRTHFLLLLWEAVWLETSMLSWDTGTAGFHLQSCHWLALAKHDHFCATGEAL